MKVYNKNNFHKHTFCVFKEVSDTEIAKLKLDFSSKSGSCYFFTAEGVYRKSNHWGRAANCKWRLQSDKVPNDSRTKVGYAVWGAFHSINEIDKLYYIEVDFNEKTVQYNHKHSSQVNKIYLRNASETAKRVREIRNLFENDKKLTYWKSELRAEELIRRVIQLMISTDYTLLQIKHAIEVANDL